MTEELHDLLERTAGSAEPPPGGWDRIVARRRRHQRSRRMSAALIAVAVAGSGLALAVLTIRPTTRSGPLTTPTPSSPAAHGAHGPVSMTVHAEGYPATCTATLANQDVHPGEAVSVAFEVRNDGTRSVITQQYDPFGEGFGRLVVRGATGATLFDTQTRHFGQSGPGAPPPKALRPGGVMHATSESVVVRWGGQLRLQATCPSVDRNPAGGQQAGFAFAGLPPFRVEVVPAGPAPALDTAVERAVGGTGGLFDQCPPGPGGAPAQGVLEPPQVPGDDAWQVRPQPLPATCWADLRRGPGFVDVTLFFTSPPVAAGSLPLVTGPVGLPRLGPARPGEVGRWELVVTPASTTTAEFPRSAGKSGPGGSFDYDYTNGHWDGAGLACTEGSFYGGPASFFPPPGQNACKART